MEKQQEILEPIKTLVNTDTVKQLKKDFSEEKATILSCTYVAPNKYINGGWINIYQTTNLINPTTNIKLPLLHAINIPIAPDKYYFSKKGDVKRFLLYFPALPKYWKFFHLIEKVNDCIGFSAYNIERNETGLYDVFIKPISSVF